MTLPLRSAALSDLPDHRIDLMTDDEIRNQITAMREQILQLNVWADDAERNARRKDTTAAWRACWHHQARDFRHQASRIEARIAQATRSHQ